MNHTMNTRLEKMALKSDEKLGMKNAKDEFMESFQILNPDDPLMNRFQNALKLHLIKVKEQITEEVNTLIATNKLLEKERLQKGNEMYETQLEIHNQVILLDKWKNLLDDIKSQREKGEINFKAMREVNNNLQKKFKEDSQRAESLTQEVKNIESHYKHSTECEEEMLNYITIAQRMSEKDMKVKWDLIHQKQEMDYIMLRITETVWALEKKLDNLRKQIEVKNNEKSSMHQIITDADTNLKILESEQKFLIDSWNKVVCTIQQRDKIYDASLTERIKMRKSLKDIDAQIEKIKKESTGQMENNEILTTIQWKLNDDMLYCEATIEKHSEKCQVLQYKIDSLVKSVEHTEAQFMSTNSEHQQLSNDNNILDGHLRKLAIRKSALDDEVITKLNDKTSQNKKIQQLDRKIHDTKAAMNQFELTALEIENQYARYLLEVEKLKNDIFCRRSELVDRDNMNKQRDEEVAKLNKEIRKLDLLIERKQKKISLLNGKISEIECMNSDSIDMMEPHKMRILSLNKNIETHEIMNKEYQHHWLRQESVIVNLTDGRNNQLQEINRLGRQIIILEQKNFKLENTINKEEKIKQHTERRMNDLHQRLVKINATLAEQQELRGQLKDKNFIVNDDYTKSLQDAEQQFINFKNSVKDLINERMILEEELKDENRNNLSWEKKLKSALEAIKIIKRERDSGGEVAIMRSEIRKMEMRLSYLRKIQEKMIKDMENCVTRRGAIVAAALTKQMKNPKVLHHKRVMFEKRMDGRRMEIKQMRKVIATIEDDILQLEKEHETLKNEIKENENEVKVFSENSSELDKQIVEGEILKHYKLECLVRKQQKIKLLQKLLDGKYKSFHKSTAILIDSLDNQKVLNSDLIEIMKQTMCDFPLLKSDIKKILLTLQQNCNS